jgi:hypothetical protein
MKIKRYSEMQIKPTKEMLEFYNKRTQAHIALVNSLYEALKQRIPGLPSEWDLSLHDKDKFEEPLFTPYVFISWKYHDPSFSIPVGIQERCNAATLLHVTSNPHHPEFWDKENAKINDKDRDKPTGTLIDATEMLSQYLVEMVCDWSAVSWEREKKSPREWAKKNIGIRWSFTQMQERKIYMLISILELILSNPQRFKI